MPKFNVILYPAMALQVSDIDAAGHIEAITKAIALAESRHLDAGGDCRLAPVYAEEFVRYIVDTVADGGSDTVHSAIFLDGIHFAGDQRDRDSGFPFYEPPDDCG